MLYEIAVKSPLRRLFTYEADEKLERGALVRVPFRSRETLGFVFGEASISPKGLKKISSVIKASSFFDDQSLSFYEKAAHYYSLSIGDLLASNIPLDFDGGNVGELTAATAKLELAPFSRASANLAHLSSAQQKIADDIAAIPHFHIHLLFGEMGSGKTEIYLDLIARVLEAGGQALVLVPEISLTPQLHDRFAERLNREIFVYHSKQKTSARKKIFAAARAGVPGLYLGARSALFLPFRALKILIVDEEHDGSFKQSERATYQARDLAILRAQIFRLPIILGSATPSLETYARVETGKENTSLYRLHPYFPKKEAQLEIIDLKKEWAKGEKSFLTNTMNEALIQNLQKHEQSLVFLNRRGSASHRQCVHCGSSDQCKRCSIALTMHFDLNRAICHWCGFQKNLRAACESCGSNDFFTGGIGTKEIEFQLVQRFPEARIARIDRDQAQSRNQIEKILRDFAAGKIDILVGTQMISKGIDIPNLSLIAVVLADQGLAVPDFRATERSFQLFTQLRGRAGRRGQESRFLIQTFFPEHPLFLALKESENSYERFADGELKIREMAHLPPYSKLTLFTLRDTDENRLAKSAAEAFSRLEALATPLGILLLGPTPAPVYKWKDYFRMHILAKGAVKGHMTGFVNSANDEMAADYDIRADRDPYQFL